MATAGTTLELVSAGQTMLHTAAGPVQVLSIPWREPHMVEPEQLQQYIAMLKRACVQQPQNADLRTCLGMAHAMNSDISKSMDALEEARRIEPENFFAQLKFAELYYRQGTLQRADNETCRAAELAGNSGELSLARKQLAEIRHLRWEGSPKPVSAKSVILVLMLMTLLGGVLLAWK